MASLTQCLPVRSVPEELLISSVRNDVVHNRRGHCIAMPCRRHSSQSGWSCKNFLLSRLHLAPYPRAAADRISSGCILMCFSQYFCPAGTRFGQPGCLQGTFGLIGMSTTLLPDFSHVKSPGGFILRGCLLSLSYLADFTIS